jgi:hypothetical protein
MWRGPTQQNPPRAALAVRRTSLCRLLDSHKQAHARLTHVPLLTLERASQHRQRARTFFLTPRARVVVPRKHNRERMSSDRPSSMAAASRRLDVMAQQVAPSGE